jgi:C-terminal processing protease CtpA/Prc
VNFSPPATPQQTAPQEARREGDPAQDAARARERADNYFFEQAQRLPGNVGYLRLTEFADAAQPEAAATAAAAMAFLRHTDALLIDLRRNFGGHPSMVALLLGYLLGPEPVLYNRFYDRPSGTTSEAWTTPPQERYGQERPVVLLTSGRTASAAESFTYCLKNLRRATVVGGRTLGAANPGGGYDLGGGFTAFVPTGRPIDPVTGTNWEGAGVEPDVEWAPDGALRRGHFVALRRLLRETSDSERRGYLEGVIESIDRDP